MVILKYPADIQKLIDIFDPYREAISSKQFDQIPPEAVERIQQVQTVVLGTRPVIQPRCTRTVVFCCPFSSTVQKMHGAFFMPS